MSDTDVVGKMHVSIVADDSKFKSGLAQAEAAAKKSGQKIEESLEKSTQKASGSAANMGRAILQASRGIQDFQAAGLNGIINNVEGIAAAFGVGAGVAGAVTLAAVAIQSLSPLIMNAFESSAKFLGLWRDESEVFKESVTGLMGGSDQLKGLAEIRSNQAEFLKGRTDAGSNSWMYSSTYDAARTALTGKSSDDIALANNLRRADEAAAHMQESFRLAADASRELAAAQRAASAKYDLTTGQKDETRLNQQLFQAAVDKYGGGDNLRTKIEQAGVRSGMRKTDADELYGKFATGDIAATRRVEELVNLGEERARIAGEAIEKNMQGVADQFRKEQAVREKAVEEEARALEDNMNNLKATFEFEEKTRIEAAKELEDNIQYLKGVAKKRDRLEDRAGDIRERIDDLMSQRAKSEITGMSNVFEKNLNAGTGEDPVVKAIEKQTEELKEITRELATLG